ncbi:hypothetical protein JW859_14650 [bacterium]|nr:hypothetical protein [bacterium]
MEVPLRFRSRIPVTQIRLAGRCWVYLLAITALLVAATGCGGSDSQGLAAERDRDGSPADPPAAAWTFVDATDAAGSAVITADPDSVNLRALSETGYDPNTGDPGLDEFLVGCHTLAPATPYRTQPDPRVLFLLTVADDQFDGSDAAGTRAFVDQMLGPTGPEYNLPKVADVFAWNSYGCCRPEFTLLAPEDGWIYIPAAEYRPGGDVVENQWADAEFWAAIDTTYDLGQYLTGSVLPVTGKITDLTSANGYTSIYPSAGGMLNDGTLYRCSLFSVDYTTVLVDDPLSWQKTTAHELAHALGGLPDMYQATWLGPSGYSTTSPTWMAGIMGQHNVWGVYTTQYIVGFEKALMGWVPLVQVKYDHRALAVQEAGLPSGRRDFYYLGPQGGIGREFFLLENIGISPTMSYGISGLMVTHFYLPQPYVSADDTSYRQIAPWFAWLTACGTEPWEGSGRDWTSTFGDYDGDMRDFLFPTGGTQLTATGIPDSRLWSGADSGIRLTGIAATDSLRPESIPAEFGPIYDEIELRRESQFHDKFGLITMDVEVGRPLQGDLNGDGIVGQGDYLMLKANLGRRIGIDSWRVPVDVNGDGRAQVVPDRDGDGYISTSERIYDDNWQLVHDMGDWLDIDCDGRNDLNPTGSGVYDIATFDANGDGVIDFFDPDGDGQAELVPDWLDANGDGVVNEWDNAVIGYNWGETTFAELWIDGNAT